MKVFALNILRSTKYGLQNFGRNIFLSIATTSVLMLTLFGVGFFLILNQISHQAIESVQDQVDINVYMADDTTEEDISRFRQYLEEDEKVASAEHITKTEALKIYRERFEDNPALISSLNVLDSNPLPDTIRVLAEDSKNYNDIWERIQSYENFDSHIESSDYERRPSRNMIANLNSYISTGQTIGITVITILGIIAILITYNTIRLTMYSYRNEIEVMRLVGANDMQIKGPFLVEGILFGIFGTIVSFLILFLVVLSIAEPVNQFIPGQMLDVYMMNNIVFILGLKLIVGITLGAGSSLIAINRYLKV